MVTECIPQPFSESQGLPGGLKSRKKYLVKKSKEISKKTMQIQMGISPGGRYWAVLKTKIL